MLLLSSISLAVAACTGSNQELSIPHAVTTAVAVVAGEAPSQQGLTSSDIAPSRLLSNSVATGDYPLSPPLQNVLPLPWADFEEMWDPRPYTDSDLMYGAGRLRVENNCLYLVVENELHYDPRHEQSRYALSLPRGWVQVDPVTNELWVHGAHNSYGQLWGPIAMGERVEVANQPRTHRSEECDNEYLWYSSYVIPCIRHFEPGRILCPAEEYSREYGVSRSEAERRLAQLLELEGLFTDLRAVEQDRIAGWGFDHGSSFVAWLWLTGVEPPDHALLELIAEHPYVEIRTGASTSHEALLASQEAFAEGNSVGLQLVSRGGEVVEFGLSRAVAWTWINHRSNVLEIGIDHRWIPHDVASVLLAGDPDAYDDSRWPPQDELYAKIADVLRDHIDVPFVVVRGLIDGEP
ncbi:MAG: hypothetical protein OXF61_06100 [Acidimicrobiaceae bacterium]|nr:hypothetical protein [Acidimicrobiaceae bacterium]